MDLNPRAVIGGNAPPLTPFDAVSAKIADLYEEAWLWLDGQPVDCQDAADGLSNLLALLRKAEKEADEARKAEKEPHLEAGRAVDAAYKPLLERCKLAADGCKKALAPWLAKIEAEKRAREEAARQEAEEKARLAREAHQAAASSTDLAAQEQAEALIAAAKKSERIASAAAKDTAKAGGTFGRSAGLRSVWRAELTDAREALKHYWVHEHQAILDLMLDLARRDVRAGQRNIPGFAVVEEKAVV